MQTATLISYTFKKDISLKEKEKFRRLFLGYKDKSNNGGYMYNRAGLLAEIPSIKPARSLIIIKNNDEKKVLMVLKRFNLDYLTWKIQLNKLDAQKLIVGH